MKQRKNGKLKKPSACRLIQDRINNTRTQFASEMHSMHLRGVVGLKCLWFIWQKEIAKADVEWDYSPKLGIENLRASLRLSLGDTRRPPRTYTLPFKHAQPHPSGMAARRGGTGAAGSRFPRRDRTATLLLREGSLLPSCASNSSTKRKHECRISAPGARWESVSSCSLRSRAHRRADGSSPLSAIFCSQEKRERWPSTVALWRCGTAWSRQEFPWGSSLLCLELLPPHQPPYCSPPRSMLRTGPPNVLLRHRPDELR